MFFLGERNKASKVFINSYNNLGSAHFVENRNGSRIIASLIMDSIPYSNKYFGVKIEGTRDPQIQSLMRKFDENLVRPFDVVRRNFSHGSDHVRFQKAGIPAILLIEKDDMDFPNQHLSTDVYDAQGVNITQALRIISGVGKTLMDLVENGL